MIRRSAMKRAALLLALAGCGASVHRADRSDGERYGPLDVGANYREFRRVTGLPYLSTVHGGRWVHVYVNDIGADAYVGGGPIPVGTIVVKASWESDGAGRPSSVAGPLYVMEKRPPGHDAEHGDWWFAIHWAEPTPAQRARLGGPIYWRGSSPKIEYCSDCHDGYDRGLGGLVPSSVLER
jgi:hypothetical protein